MLHATNLSTATQGEGNPIFSFCLVFAYFEKFSSSQKTTNQEKRTEGWKWKEAKFGRKAHRSTVVSCILEGPALIAELTRSSCVTLVSLALSLNGTVIKIHAFCCLFLVFKIDSVQFNKLKDFFFFFIAWNMNANAPPVFVYRAWEKAPNTEIDCKKLLSFASLSL